MNPEPSPLHAIRRIDLARHDLRLRRRIPSATGGNLPVQPRLFCRVTRMDAAVGYGEAAPHPIHGPRLEGIEADLRAACTSRATPAPLPLALAMALIDAEARAKHRPAWQQLDIAAPPASCRTVVTFGGDDPDALCQEIAAANPPAIKLKLRGGPADLTVIRAITQTFPVPLAVDVNGAWAVEDAPGKLAALEAIRPDLLWVEQPCPPERIDRRLPTHLPIFADEGVDHPGADLSVYDGVVLKPARAGIARCIEVAQRARSAGLQVTMGCHLQSSLMSNVTLMLAGLATCAWIDLDSVILVDNDPFEPPDVDPHTGRMQTPHGDGFGTHPRVLLPWQPIFHRV